MSRYEALVDALRRAVFDSPGDVDRTLRDAARRNEGLPDALRAYVDKVARHAHKITDEEVEALKKAGYTEDQLFEITVSAAVGAGLKRLELGLAPLRGGK
jgi:alkylhydroperoxidase family enzyme